MKIFLCLALSCFFFLNGCVMFRNYQVPSVAFEPTHMRVIGNVSEFASTFYILGLIPVKLEHSENSLKGFFPVNDLVQQSLANTEGENSSKKFIINPIIENQISFVPLLPFGYLNTMTVSGIAAEFK